MPLNITGFLISIGTLIHHIYKLFALQFTTIFTFLDEEKESKRAFHRPILQSHVNEFP